jgi:hypothetical protein
MKTVLHCNQFVDAQAPQGRARYRRSPASTSTQANATDGVGPRPSSSLKDIHVRDHRSHGALLHQSARAWRTPREACRSELIIAARTVPPSGSVWLQCAGAFRQRKASAQGLISDLQPRREQPPRCRILKSPGYARRPGPVPGAWPPNNSSTSQSSPPAFIYEDESWIWSLF